MILNTGTDFERFDIGRPQEGNCFWMAGNQRVGSVREFVEEILSEVAGQDAETYSVRVVYSFIAVEFEGTNTQYLKLTKDDVKQLQEVLARMEAGESDRCDTRLERGKR